MDERAWLRRERQRAGAALAGAGRANNPEEAP